MDINSLISQYLKTSGEADISSVRNAIENLTADVGSINQNSIFTFENSSDTISEDDFVELMCNATGKNASEIQDDVSILFSILDNEEEGKGSLSKNELSLFLGADNTISKFSVWDHLMAFNEDEVKAYSSMADDETDSAEETGETDQTESSATTGSSKSSDVEDTEEAESSNAVGNNEGDTTADEADVEENLENVSDSNPSTYDFTNPSSAKSFVSTFIDDTLTTPAQVIDWLLNEGIITDEDAQLLKSAYTNYSDKEESQIQALVATGMSREEAIAKLEDAGKLDSNNASSLNEEYTATLSDEDAQLYANQLHDAMKGGFFGGLGTDDEQFNSIMNNSSLSSSDWVKIIQLYNDSYGSFIKDVDDDFSGTTQDSIQAKIADHLLEAAEKGDEDAIDLLCEEFYNGTAGQWLTADEFIAEIFAKGSDDVIAKMARRYASVTGSDIFKDIKGDFSFGTEDKYIARINEALINCREDE